MRRERAARTRLAILEAAAEVFDRRGYDAATISEILQVAGVTKGALYFHFDSKEAVALGVLDQQDQRLSVPPQSTKVQELVDTALVHAYRVRTDPVVRAGVRLSLGRWAGGADPSGPFLRWREATSRLLRAAKENGELLPHVVPEESADVCVGAFAGVQSMSKALTGYADLDERAAALQRHLMPAICVPALLDAIDFSPERGGRIGAALGEPARGAA